MAIDTSGPPRSCEMTELLGALCAHGPRPGKGYLFFLLVFFAAATGVPPSGSWSTALRARKADRYDSGDAASSGPRYRQPLTAGSKKISKPACSSDGYVTTGVFDDGRAVRVARQRTQLLVIWPWGHVRHETH